MVDYTASIRVQADPTKIKAWIDGLAFTTLRIVEINIQGQTALIFAEYDAP